MSSDEESGGAAQIDPRALGRLIRESTDTFVESLAQRWNAWKLSSELFDVHEVVGALLARQVTLACELARSPGIWNEHSAPLFLRAMCDVYINVAWILKDPVPRAREFILYGLGQVKLEIAHRKEHIQATTPTPEDKQILDALEGFLRSQRHEFLTVVNLGSWSGKSTRSMAEEADCIDFYNFAYTPFSGVVHSQWQHVSQINLEYCANPLHGLHRVPAVEPLPASPYYLYLVAKYLEKTFLAFDSKYPTIAVPSVLTAVIELIGETEKSSEGDSDDVDESGADDLDTADRNDE